MSKKIAFITSRGGHLYQITPLKKAFPTYEKIWITFRGEDVNYYLKGERVYFAFYPDSRNIVNFFRNLILSLKILKRERPDFLISAGAGIAVPFFLTGKYFFGIKIVFIEPYDFVAYPSLTGRILYNFVDLFLVQHKKQKKWFPKAIFWGSLL